MVLKIQAIIDDKHILLEILNKLYFLWFKYQGMKNYINYTKKSPKSKTHSQSPLIKK